jgi:hypothetical protein
VLASRRIGRSLERPFCFALPERSGSLGSEIFRIKVERRYRFDAGGKMKSITKREIAILVVIFMAVPIALWAAISVIDLFLPSSHSDMIAKGWAAGPKR